MKTIMQSLKKLLSLRTWLETRDLCWFSVSRQITHHDERNFVVKISPLAFHFDDMGARLGPSWLQTKWSLSQLGVSKFDSYSASTQTKVGRQILIS